MITYRFICPSGEEIDTEIDDDTHSKVKQYMKENNKTFDEAMNDMFVFAAKSLGLELPD